MVNESSLQLTDTYQNRRVLSGRRLILDRRNNNDFHRENDCRISNRRCISDRRYLNDMNSLEIEIKVLSINIKLLKELGGDVSEPIKRLELLRSYQFAMFLANKRIH